ncbi:MAG TPA: hypothetical protein VH187_10300 [Scandinavium sp.]|uniref:hypothetical protein n=1 Tax=Scandinavium sp. TaxID=2830653 RepID=UPI002E2FDF65|nr:hypothetical protein [Scandinavium sp.]HEX4501526.1 hypothetical protein [Scandinavium sp.]
MNRIPDNSIIVIDMAGDVIKLRVSEQNLIDRMQLIGFSLKEQFMVMPVVDVQDKQRIIKLLINEGALFLYGNGWYPSEVMEYYKDQKINFGKYKIIFWTDENTYHIEER